MESVQTELNLNGLVFPKKEIELTELEKRVFNLIPVGKENAKTGAYIADTLDISLRHVTGLVKKLRLKHCDIGSTTYEGYYRFKNHAEYQEYMHRLETEQKGRNEVIEAMRLTKMAKEITVESEKTAQKEVIAMTVTIRDALIYFDAYGSPLLGTVEIDTPLNANATLDIDVGNQNFTAFIKQIDCLIFKINNKEFGIITDNSFHTDDDYYYWNEYTESAAGHYLHENSAKHELI